MIFEKQIVSMYKGMMHSRCDDTETVFYFSHKDFLGLNAEAYSFKSSLGHTLCGYIYSYEGADDKKLVVFDHGMGSGHRAYMKEIEMLCRRGYVVLSYDHTGCMESGANSTNGLSQSLCDLNDCITSIKATDRFVNSEISVIGHSWGAFATLNITALHTDITHIVAISGFVSVTEMIGTLFAGLLKGYRKPILELEKNANPKFFEFNAVKTLSKSKTKALLIYSDNDKLCKKKHYDILKSNLPENENIRFILTIGKGHNPNYTDDAVKYIARFAKARAKLCRKKNLTAEEKAAFVASYDFNKMTEQDESLWEKIFEHLEA